MITGAHAVIYSSSAEEARAFLRDTLGLRAVDAGGGWLVFELPPAELAVHPGEAGGEHELYFMCDDIHATVAELRSKGVEFNEPVSDQRWGLVTSMTIPGGVQVGLYQPRHHTAIG